VKLGLADSGREFLHCMHDCFEMGFSRRKLLGLFAQMIICGDITNIREVWDGDDGTGDQTIPITGHKSPTMQIDEELGDDSTDLMMEIDEELDDDAIEVLLNGIQPPSSISVLPAEVEPDDNDALLLSNTSDPPDEPEPGIEDPVYGPHLPDDMDALIKSRYPNGFKRHMMLFPKHFSKLAPFHFDYDQLPNEIYKNQAEQHTLRTLNRILERTGTEYPDELPPLEEVDRKHQTKEWLAAHNYNSTIAEKIYHSHTQSMIVQM
jgi:hypothetical protein